MKRKHININSANVARRQAEFITFENLVNKRKHKQPQLTAMTGKKPPLSKEAIIAGK